MKRSVMKIVLCLCLALILPLSANAAFYEGQEVLQYVVDQADLLSAQEKDTLQQTAQSLSESYDCDVLIAIVDNMNGYTAGDYASALNSGYWWDSEDAVLFLLAMEEREWYIATFGDGIHIFTDYGIDSIGEKIVPYLSAGQYYEGFAEYLTLLPEYFEAWKMGAPVDNEEYDSGPREEVVYYPETQIKTIWSVLPGSLLIGLVAAAISLIVMRSAMNTKRRQRNAGEYLKPGSYHLRIHQDLFLYSNLSKTRRQQNTGGSGGHRGGGSSIHRSSAGRSHGGRGGRF